jgi:hypothetical protein
MKIDAVDHPPPSVVLYQAGYLKESHLLLVFHDWERLLLAHDSHIAEIGKSWQLRDAGDTTPRMGPKDANRFAGEQTPVEVRPSRDTAPGRGTFPQAAIGTFGAVVATDKVLFV